ncbi:MAG TPA: hypothetical protein VFV50_11025, partial [Bdellovibrionales bacterium]|nr:hypothetical protein [Bdellovibrionales bacterium]
TDRITLDDEFNVHTWLWTFLIRNQRAHFFYQAQTAPPRQHYVRFNTVTGAKELDIYPDWGGTTIKLQNLDGFCATGTATQNMYCVSRTKENKLGSIFTADNGSTWQDYAMAGEAARIKTQIGGYRRLTYDGYVVGTYTEYDAQPAGAPVSVKFFRIKTSAAD